MQRIDRTMPLSLLAALLCRSWLVALVTIVVCAGFAAHAAASLIAADTLTLESSTTITPRQRLPRPPELSERARDPAQLVARNMFCSSCGPAPGPASLDGAPPEMSAAVLIAIEASPEPRATLRVVASHVQGSWGLGEQIPGLGRIERIGLRMIEVVDPGGVRGRLTLLDGSAVHVAVAGAAGTAMPDAPAAADPDADRVRKLDEQNYEVDRSLVRELVSAGATPNGPRFRPNIVDGKMTGVTLMAVRPGSIPRALGLKSGDQLTALDGVPFTGAQQLLDLYAKLDQLTAVELSGTRNGQPLVRTLRLR